MFRTWNLYGTIEKYIKFDDFWHEKKFGTFRDDVIFSYNDKRKSENTIL